MAVLLAAAVVVIVRDRNPARQHPVSTNRSEPEATDHLAVLVRTWARAAVVREVAAGRLSVPDAAAVFGWLDQQPPAAPTEVVRATARTGYKDLVAARTESDWLCLQVVIYARSDRALSPARLFEVEDEYRRVCAAPGGSVLPPVAAADCRELLARAAAAVRAAREPCPEGTRVPLDGLRLVADR